MQIEQTELLMAVFGAFDENIKQIERELNVSVISRGTELKITGEDEGVSIAARAITALLAMAGRGESIGTQTVQYVIGLAKDGRESEVHTMSRDVLCITAKGKPVKAKTLGQKKYMEAIRKNTIVMGVGPAGTGKTYLAVAAAVAAFRDKQVSRIILTRPAVEAGEKARLSARRPAEQGRPLSAPAVRRSVRHARRGKTSPSIRSAAPSRSPRLRTCAAERSTTALSFWMRRRTPRASR